ncbi:META domain-containing protein [Mesorhizobium sp. B2-3-6]|nr:META domain-containing protein [Mesorhizobium sp. B2-4-10]TPM23046.1 META domain-containing protein [Mesorhizobium sp. B2-3-6]
MARGNHLYSWNLNSWLCVHFFAERTPSPKRDDGLKTGCRYIRRNIWRSCPQRPVSGRPSNSVTHRLEAATVSPKSCSSLPLAALLAVLSLYATATSNAEAASLAARGNEPGWQISISDTALSFNALGGETFTVQPAPRPTRQGDADTYLATVDGRQLALTIAAKICVDTMSGMPYPQTATVILGDRKFEGCAGEPGDLLRGDWLVDEIREETTVASSKPTLAFEPDGRIHGNGSCNRFFGGFALTGEALTISETGSSRMICDQPLMDQERNLLEALGSVRRFEAPQTGRVQLLDKDGQRLVSLRR